MRIVSENAMAGNDAMASVLLLYYQIIAEGGIGNDVNVYIDPKRFNGFDFLEVMVDPEHQPEIDEKLIREGAVVYLLCHLNDVISDYEDDYLDQDITKRILSVANISRMSAVPEAIPLLEMISGSMDYGAYRKILHSIYSKYVLGAFETVVESAKR